MLILFLILAIVQPPVIGLYLRKRAAANPKQAPYKNILAVSVILMGYVVWLIIYKAFWASGAFAA